MKLLLTSAGIRNQSLTNALLELTNKPFSQTHLVYIPTAANVEEGDKGWMIDDFIRLTKLGLASIDIVDISALSKEIWLPRIEKADIIMVGGGNTFHLMYWIRKSGLDKLLPDLLKDKVYVGISAGSCIAGPIIYNSVQNLFDEKYELEIKEGLGLVDFQFIPHLNSPYFEKIRIENLSEASKLVKETAYALDDNSALKIIDDNVEAVSEGVWKKFN